MRAIEYREHVEIRTNGTVTHVLDRDSDWLENPGLDFENDSDGEPLTLSRGMPRRLVERD